MASTSNPRFRAVTERGTLLFTILSAKGQSIRFFEHPELGEDAPMVAVFPDNTVDFNTDAYDQSTARLYAGLDN